MEIDLDAIERGEIPATANEIQWLAGRAKRLAKIEEWAYENDVSRMLHLALYDCHNNDEVSFKRTIEEYKGFNLE